MGCLRLKKHKEEVAASKMDGEPMLHHLCIEFDVIVK